MAMSHPPRYSQKIGPAHRTSTAPRIGKALRRIPVHTLQPFSRSVPDSLVKPDSILTNSQVSRGQPGIRRRASRIACRHLRTPRQLRLMAHPLMPSPRGPIPRTWRVILQFAGPFTVHHPEDPEDIPFITLASPLHGSWKLPSKLQNSWGLQTPSIIAVGQLLFALQLPKPARHVAPSWSVFR